MHTRNLFLIGLAFSLVISPGCKREEKSAAPMAPPAAKVNVAPTATAPAAPAPATTVPVAITPVDNAVLAFRVLAEKAEDEKTEFAAFHEALAKDGSLSLPDQPDYRWFVIRDPEFLLRSPGIDKRFRMVQKASSIVLDRRDDQYFVLAHTGKQYVMMHDPGGVPWHLRYANALPGDAGEFFVDIDFDRQGIGQMAALTQANIGRMLGVFVYDKLVMTAGIKDVVAGIMRFGGAYSEAEAGALVSILQQGID